MTLSIVVHRPESGAAEAGSSAAEDMRTAVRDAIWEIADAHWAMGQDAILVSTDLSPDYILSHFQRALARRGFGESGLLLVSSIGPRAAWSGLPQDAEGWLREVLA
ncbi:hypothetical protein [Falsiroseomonas selenitidurans]|uniref:Uncharacterized protein n=1 Tax=Falsiroseomonas selenitidurans TaxID=2716335 RepID=A0ABX1E5S3_9PROT|nr:hypothetical protein [Falsiroseomonas selenitidurans]NKC30877.1 hypothetical protein [Falsiroseomonas selenitidurans]